MSNFAIMETQNDDFKTFKVAKQKIYLIESNQEFVILILHLFLQSIYDLVMILKKKIESDRRT